MGRGPTRLLHEGADAQDVGDRMRRGPGTGQRHRGRPQVRPGVRSGLGGRRSRGCRVRALVEMRARQRGRRRRRGSQRADLIAQDAADGADRGHVVLVAHAVGQQAVADLPREDAGVSLLVIADVFDHGRRGDPGFAAADGSGQDGARFVVAGQDFADAAVRHPQLAADVAGPDAELSQLHDAQADGVGQRAPVDENAAQLVHLAVGVLCQGGRARVGTGRWAKRREKTGGKKGGVKKEGKKYKGRKGKRKKREKVGEKTKGRKGKGKKKTRMRGEERKREEKKNPREGKKEEREKEEIEAEKKSEIKATAKKEGEGKTGEEGEKKKSQKRRGGKKGRKRRVGQKAREKEKERGREKEWQGESAARAERDAGRTGQDGALPAGHGTPAPPGSSWPSPGPRWARSPSRSPSRSPEPGPEPHSPMARSGEGAAPGGSAAAA